MKIYKYYGMASLIIRFSNDNYINIKTFSINRFYEQKYQMIFFDDEDEFFNYKKMMYRKHKVLDKKYVYDGQFIFKDAVILEGCNQWNYKKMGRDFLKLNGIYKIYSRFGYVYFIKEDKDSTEILM